MERKSPIRLNSSKVVPITSRPKTEQPKEAQKLTRTVEVGSHAQRRTDAAQPEVTKTDLDIVLEQIDGLLSINEQMPTNNFQAFQEVFKHYEVVGITIPKDILSKYQGKEVSITASEAEELKNLAIEGDKRLKSNSVFRLPETRAPILENLQNNRDVLNVLSITKKLRKSAEEYFQATLTSTDLLDPNNEKLKFARDPKVKVINMVFLDKGDIPKMIAFMEDPNNADLLAKVQDVKINCQLCSPGKDPQTDNSQKFMDLLGIKCPNLKSLFCAFHFTSLTLTMNNLESFYFSSCYSQSKITLNTPNLESLRGSEISEAIFILNPPMDKLLSISIDTLKNGGALKMPPVMDHLKNFSIGTLNNANLRLPQKMDNLELLSFQSVGKDAKVIVPEQLPGIKKVSYKRIDNPKFKKKLQGLKKQSTQ